MNIPRNISDILDELNISYDEMYYRISVSMEQLNDNGDQWELCLNNLNLLRHTNIDNIIQLIEFIFEEEDDSVVDIYPLNTENPDVLIIEVSESFDFSMFTLISIFSLTVLTLILMLIF